MASITVNEDYQLLLCNNIYDGYYSNLGMMIELIEKQSEDFDFSSIDDIDKKGYGLNLIKEALSLADITVLSFLVRCYIFDDPEPHVNSEFFVAVLFKYQDELYIRGFSFLREGIQPNVPYGFVCNLNFINLQNPVQEMLNYLNRTETLNDEEMKKLINGSAKVIDKNDVISIIDPFDNDSDLDDEPPND